MNCPEHLLYMPILILPCREPKTSSIAIVQLHAQLLPKPGQVAVTEERMENNEGPTLKNLNTVS
jgi:hypothetical protein